MTDKFLLAAIAIYTFLPMSVVAQDTVTIATGRGGQTKLNGRVVDYTGRELRLELSGGRQQVIPGNKVLHVETPLIEQNTTADSLFARNEFGQALAMYRRALDGETRRWVRRRILAQIVRCYRALSQPRPACEAFLLLTQSDPHTPYFDCIPLAWLPSQPSPDLEQAAQKWMSRKRVPTAVLLGASHLMSTGNRQTALKRLKSLEVCPDTRIAQLAHAQTWRAKVVTAKEHEINLWANSIEAMPNTLRAGPYFILGLARGTHRQYEESALALLRIPILFPEQRELAARSLLGAGKSLERLNRRRKAAKLYSELLKKYPKSRSTFEAREQLENMTTQ